MNHQNGPVFPPALERVPHREHAVLEGDGRGPCVPTFLTSSRAGPSVPTTRSLPWASQTSSAATSPSNVSRCGPSMTHVDMYASLADLRRTTPPYTRCIVTPNAIHRDSRANETMRLWRATHPRRWPGSWVSRRGHDGAARRGAARLRPRTGAGRRPHPSSPRRWPVRRHCLLLPVQRPPDGPLAGPAPADHAGGRALDRLAQAHRRGR